PRRGSRCEKVNLVRVFTARSHFRGGLLVGLAAFAYSWLVDHYDYVSDDAGITLRYAERIAHGAGFNYNDGEAVNGASNPLYTLTEAALLRLGCSPETAILLVASACFALTAGVLFSTFARFYSKGSAVFALLALIAFTRPFETIVDGMETPLVMLLATLLFRALHSPRDLFPGIVLGFLVANKLDGALAAVAFTVIFLAGRRRFPWRAAVIALLCAAPVFLVLLASFGSIVPNSMLVKMSVHSIGFHMDPLWLHRLLIADGFWSLYLLAWISLLWLPFARELGRSFPIAVIQLWFLLVMAAFAAVNLGAAYPWYEATPVILTVILASFTVHALAASMAASWRWPRLAWDPGDNPPRMWPVALAAVAGLVWQQGRYFAARSRADRVDHALHASDSWELGRQAAGAWLRKHTSATEDFITFEGLPAFEYEGPVYDFSLLNSAPDHGRLDRAAYLLTGPIGLEDELPRALQDRKLVASFRFDAQVGLYLLYARLDSEAWRNGARHLVFPTPALAFPKRDNTWILPVTGRDSFTVQTWQPVALLFTPRLAGASDPVRLVIRANGVELGSADLVPGEDHAPMRLVSRKSTKTGEHAFEIDCRSAGSADPGRARVELAEVLVRSGEPLRPEDFKLATERVRKRIEYVAAKGLPCGFTRR
ncbi:MAG: hypothetical protein ACKVXR_03345, partial [Planctomycetota bacterium]